MLRHYQGYFFSCFRLSTKLRIHHITSPKKKTNKKNGETHSLMNKWKHAKCIENSTTTRVQTNKQPVIYIKIHTQQTTETNHKKNESSDKKMEDESMHLQWIFSTQRFFPYGYTIFNHSFMNHKNTNTLSHSFTPYLTWQSGVINNSKSLSHTHAHKYTRTTFYCRCTIEHKLKYKHMNDSHQQT